MKRTILMLVDCYAITYRLYQTKFHFWLLMDMGMSCLKFMPTIVRLLLVNLPAAGSN